MTTLTPIIREIKEFKVWCHEQEIKYVKKSDQTKAKFYYDMQFMAKDCLDYVTKTFEKTSTIEEIFDHLYRSYEYVGEEEHLPCIECANKLLQLRPGLVKYLAYKKRCIIAEQKKLDSDMLLLNLMKYDEKYFKEILTDNEED